MAINNPLIPGDPFSYDLKWIVDKLKEAIALYQPLSDDFNDLKNFVENYFDNLDLTAEVQQIIDEMESSGYFDQIIYSIAVTDGRLQTIITDWLTQNVDPTGSAVMLDDTLTISGAAADAKAAGRADTIYNGMIWCEIPDEMVARGTNSGTFEEYNTDSRIATVAPLEYPVDVIFTSNDAQCYVTDLTAGAAIKTWSKGGVVVPAHHRFVATVTMTPNTNTYIEYDKLRYLMQIYCPASKTREISAMQTKASGKPGKIFDITDLRRGTCAAPVATPLLLNEGYYNEASRAYIVPQIALKDIKLHFRYKMSVECVSAEGERVLSGWLTNGVFTVPKGATFTANLAVDNSVNTETATEILYNNLYAEYPEENEALYSMKSVARLGYDTLNPDTPPAQSQDSFFLAAKHGYKIMLADCTFTSDHVPVCIHDDIINAEARNPDGSVISQTLTPGSLTLQQLNYYDWGAYKGAAYKGYPLNTVETFLKFCKINGFYPFVEIRGTIQSDENADSLAAIVNKLGFDGNITFIVDDVPFIRQLKTRIPKFKFYVVVGSVYTETYNLNRINNAVQTADDGHVSGIYYYSPDHVEIGESVLNACIENGLEMGYSEVSDLATWLAGTNNLYCSVVAVKPEPVNNYILK